MLLSISFEHQGRKVETEKPCSQTNSLDITNQYCLVFSVEQEVWLTLGKKCFPRPSALGNIHLVPPGKQNLICSTKQQSRTTYIAIFVWSSFDTCMVFWGRFQQ